MVRDILASAGGAVEDKLYPEDVFVSYVRTGTGADATVTTNIDMTKGYMVWTKGRSGATDNAIYDSARGVTKDLVTNSTAAQTTQATGLKAVSTTGHTIGSLAKMNTNGATYVDWVFKKAPKFFDIVTYTGNGVAGRQIPHDLGCEVGMMIVKGTNATSTDWAVYHKSHGNIGGAQLNMTTAFFTQSGWWNNTTPTSNSFTVGTNYSVNTLGTTYVAYLYAHDTSADGIIQCGSFTTDGSGNATVNLGWEPQYLLTKSVGFSDNWYILDDKRGFPVASASTKILVPNSMSSESTSTGGFLNPTSTGFTVLPSAFGSTQTHIYLAIRRPNKVPTSGTEVYNAIARTGTGAVATVSGVGFAPDLLWCSTRSHNIGTGCIDRLRGGSQQVSTNTTSTEVSDTSLVTSFDMLGATLGIDNTGYLNQSERTYINHFFKRAPKFFDIVCYTGTGVARTVNHNLGVVPEMIWIKDRKDSSNWVVYHSNAGATKVMHLNTVGESYTYTSWNNTEPTLTNFTIGSTSSVNASAHSFISYLFASLQGISKVGSYAGNGTSQTIDCGFTTGSRFILVKRTDSAGGDWYIWDTARGIVAANDPHLSLNATAVEVTTDDSIDPESRGFIVNQVAATNINVNGGSYIFLAIA